MYICIAYRSFCLVLYRLEVYDTQICEISSSLGNLFDWWSVGLLWNCGINLFTIKRLYMLQAFLLFLLLLIIIIFLTFDLIIQQQNTTDYVSISSILWEKNLFLLKIIIIIFEKFLLFFAFAIFTFYFTFIEIIIIKKKIQIFPTFAMLKEIQTIWYDKN